MSNYFDHLLYLSCVPQLLSNVKYENTYRMGRPERLFRMGPPERLFRMGPPERMFRMGRPERLFRMGPPERMFRMGAPERLYRTGRPERLFRMGPPERMFRMGPPERLYRMGAPERLFRMGPPERLFEWPGVETMLSRLLASMLRHHKYDSQCSARAAVDVANTARTRLKALALPRYIIVFVDTITITCSVDWSKRRHVTLIHHYPTLRTGQIPLRYPASEPFASWSATC